MGRPGDRSIGVGELSTSVRPTMSEEPSSAVSVFSGVSNSTGRSPDTASSLNQDLSQRLPKTKKRREKPRIELAPDQPPTTQGKPRARVYVACIQCRTRKIRCDGAKPVCHNCGRRTTGNNECTYDPIPKRRGPDKTPGARQRMARDIRNQLDSALIGSRRRHRAQGTPAGDPHNAEHPYGPPSLSPSSPSPATSIILPTSFTIPSAATVEPNSSYDACSPVVPEVRSTFLCPCHGLSPCPVSMASASGQKTPHVYSSYNDTYSGLSDFDLAPFRIHQISTHGYITELDEDGNERSGECPGIVSQPSMSFARDVWWDSLLLLYMSPNSTRLRNLAPGQREMAARDITSDLRFVFRASNYWFSFFHIPTFFGNFFDPGKRRDMQPSLVLALLAMSTFWQSSEIGNGQPGRERALRFRDEAQGALEASINAGWLDETLAQAAWLLALFEVCAHPRHSSERCVSALVMLDSMIRSLSLTLVDADDPTATMFLPGTVPIVPRDEQRTSWFGYQPLVDSHPTIRQSESLDMPVAPASPDAGVSCSCKSLTLAQHWPSVSDHAPMWLQTPAWNDSWSETDIRKESIRRLCWSAMVTAAGHISYTTAHRSHNPDLFIADPSNYALLFSGESIARSPSLSTSSKDTIWALQDRCFLLWHACIRMRTGPLASDATKAQFATKAWLEADALEAALNKHTCSIERAFIYQAREYIFNTRMSISYEFQRYIPLVTALPCDTWHRIFRHQAVVAERFMHGLHTITGNANNLLARRPFFVFWFMGQITRSLSLWECDNTLSIALDVCKALLPAIDYLSALWPCAEQRHRYNKLRERLNNACYIAGVCLPPPPNFSLPSSSSPESLV
ncbi:Glucose transport transcription regulator RGT1 [Leucoagaricus sp. SymC.cos]|nr:Glucose transport transcription regulator RGT1 [Leucoagaricus sp. SymC.cos]